MLKDIHIYFKTCCLSHKCYLQFTRSGGKLSILVSYQKYINRVCVCVFSSQFHDYLLEQIPAMFSAITNICTVP